MSTARVEALGDHALLVVFGDCVDSALNARALAAAAVLQAADLPGLHDIAPAYASVCVHYDPRAWADTTGAQLPHARLASRISGIVDNLPASPDAHDAAAIDIPVCYGGEFGPDLDNVAANAKLSADAAIALHCAAAYRVAMLGFAPGFPYLLGLDPALHTPRRANPRTRVPAGAVAIGGAQTGIYPRELPGGWQIIGRTPLALFDAARNPAALLAPGQSVRFSPIGAGEFAALAQ
jgi:KipI family sensor histidine kinase inhibitor